MDTTVTTPEVETQVPSVLHRELDKASEKLAKRNERSFDSTGFGATTGGLYITRIYIDRVIAAVEAKLSQREPADSKDQALWRVLRGLDPEVIGLCVLQHGLHSVALGDTLRDTNLAIGHALNRELWAAKLLQTDRQLAHRISKAVKARHGSLSHRVTAAKRAADRAGFTMKDWSRKETLTAGNWGVLLLTESLPEVFVMHEHHVIEHEQWQLGIQPGAVEMAEDAVAQAVLQNPVYQPRVEPPKPWTEFAARFAEDPRATVHVSLLRTFHKDTISAAKGAIRTGAMAPALAGLNTLQSVPWKINTWIMGVIQQCYDRHIPVVGLTPKRELDEPARLSDDAFAKLSIDERIVRRKEIAGIKKFNRALTGQQLLFKEDMEIARGMALHDQFYVPMNMDWRGRVYGLTHFNFAREDRVRAMFLFANGEAIGEEGIYWLKIHVANCGDFDKVSKRPMEERIKWINENLAAISRAAADPIGAATLKTAGDTSWTWTQADSPFLFLAACRELIAAVTQGTAYVASVPVSFDGSCSGLQHLAAMTRAPEGRHVNLTNNAEPADVYQLVADLAKEHIEQDAGLCVEEGSSKGIETADRERRLAKACLDFGVGRTLVKRNVMTFAYSSKEYGMAQQHLEDTMEPLKLQVLKGDLEVHPFGDDEGYAASKYLARKVLNAIKEVVTLPAEAMGFMQALARALAHEGKPLRWMSPAGIPWINRYHESTSERVELWLNDNGVKVKTRIKVATGLEKEISKEKAASGVSPNFVHACDASHLLLTVQASATEGITDIATVHDSFGCLPSRAGRFNQIIREQFLKMYEDHDVLAELLASAKADLTEANHHKLPALPEKGALDLKEILDAKYAFA